MYSPIPLSMSLTLPARSGERTHSQYEIPEGVKGTSATIAMMRKLVTNAKRRGEVRELIGKILNPSNCSRPCDSKNYFCYAKAAYEWVRDNILYVYDPHQVEFLESASFLLKSKVGDCDSMDTLLASIFESMGFQTQFVTVMADASRPDEFSHVYTRVKLPNYGWVAADPIMPKKWFGWEPDAEGRRYWPASEDDINTPLDTTPSIQVGSPNPAPNMSLFGSRMAGLGALAHGGHGHHGGRGGWGGGWDGDSFGFDSGWAPVIVPESPIIAFHVDSIQVVPEDHVEPQSEEAEESAYHSYGLMGMGDSITDKTPTIEIDQITSGTVLRQIQSLERSAAENVDTLQITKAAVDQLEPGFDRRAALQTYSAAKSLVDQQTKTLRKLRDKYNEFIVAAQTYIGVVPNMPGLAALSDAPSKASIFTPLAQSVTALRDAAMSNAQAVRQKVVDAYQWTGEASKTALSVGTGAVTSAMVGNVALSLAAAFVAVQVLFPKHSWFAGLSGRRRG